MLKQMRDAATTDAQTHPAEQDGVIPWEQFRATQAAIPPPEVHEPDPERADTIDQLVAAELPT